MRRWLKRTFWTAILFILIAAGVIVIPFIIDFFTFPGLVSRTSDKRSASIIYDADEQPLKTFCLDFCRDIMPLEDMGHFVNIASAAEDKKFWTRLTAFDFKAMARALGRDISHRKFKEGGSTITQQLAKKAFLSDELSVGSLSAVF